MNDKTIHQFTVRNLGGKEVNLDKYKGKVVMVVNTASRCGFTPQLRDLEELYRQYKDRGFEILAFPSNDFGSQEPLQGEAIQQFCKENYDVSFPVFEKSHVVGSGASPVFKFLSSKKLNGKLSSKPRWNFHKYLIDKEGKVVDYFYTITKPQTGRVKRAIERLLKK